MVEAEPALKVTGDGPPARPAPRAEDPFERLFLDEYGRVVAIALRVLADRAEAEDVAQEVFVDLHQRHSASASFAAPWLYSAAVHTALNRLRGRRRREQRELVDARDTTPSADPADAAVAADDRRRVRSALARLKQRQAAVLVLRYSGLSYAEVGTALGVGTGQVGTLLKRAEQALRKEITRGTSA